eukprot:COSAG02_NODE_217_length_28595_cov_19.642371_9_plen_121_part_00
MKVKNRAFASQSNALFVSQGSRAHGLIERPRPHSNGLKPSVLPHSVAISRNIAPIMPDHRRALCPVRRGVITGIRPYARYHPKESPYLTTCFLSYAKLFPRIRAAWRFGPIVVTSMSACN